MGCPFSRHSHATMLSRRNQSRELMEIVEHSDEAPKLLSSMTPILVKSRGDLFREAGTQIESEEPLLDTKSPTQNAGQTENVVFQADAKEEEAALAASEEAEETQCVTEKFREDLSLWVQAGSRLWGTLNQQRTFLLCKTGYAMIFRAADTGLDVRTTVRFYKEGAVKWASLIFFFIILSPIIQCSFVYWKTRRCKFALPFLIPGSFQHLRREWRQLQLVRALPQVAFYHNVHLLAGASHLNDVLASIESCFESLPQACVQAYAYQMVGDMDFLNRLSLSFSVIGCIMGVISAAKALRDKAEQREQTAKGNSLRRSAASATGDTLAMHGIPLCSNTVQALASFVSNDTFITTCVLSDTNCTDDHVHAITAGAPHFVSVSLNNCKEITDHGVIKLAENCKNLCKVFLLNCCLVTDIGVTALAEGCSGLTEVGFTGCVKITDEGMIGLAEKCKGLEKVNVKGCKRITDKGVTKLAENCKRLELVGFNECNITDEALSKLADNCAELRKAGLGGCEGITNVGLTKLAEKCKKLTWVHLWGYKHITNEISAKFPEGCELKLD